MKLFQSALCLSSIVLLLAACSDSNSSSSSSDPKPIDKIDVGACEVIDDSTLNAQVVEATDSLILFVFGIATAPEDLETLQKRTETAKTVFRKALLNHPNSCDAQLGLAVAQMVNVIGNEDVSAIYKAFATGDDEQIDSLFNLQSDFAGTTIQAAVEAKDVDDEVVTTRAQDVIAGEVLPSIDSAIYLLNNIRQTEDYMFSYETEDFEINLGQGELALSVGTLNALKAFLIVVASYDFDASMDDSYAWLETSINWSGWQMGNDMTAEEKAALEHTVSLFEKGSPFLSVKDSWKTAFKSVPDLLDSAIENLKDSYDYLLKQAESGKPSILSPFVGNSEESDFYTDEIEMTLFVLDSIQSVLHGTMTATIAGEEVQINVRKFFEMTDGFQKYLPYHTVNPVDSWTDSWKDPKYVSWISAEEYAEGSYMLYAENVVFEKVKETLDSSVVSGVFGESLDEMYFSSDDENFWYASVQWDGCRYSVQEGFDVNEERSWFSLDTAVCKAENGTAEFKAFDTKILPNPFNFTDKSGKVTLSFADFGKEMMNLKERAADKDEKVSLIEQTIIFPDPTFEGIFPDMDQHKLSAMLEKLF